VPVLDVLTFVLAAVAVIVVLQYLADRTGLPAAALLTVAGLVYGVLPGPNLTLDPHLILTFVIPEYPTATIAGAVAISLGVALLLRPLWLAFTELLPRAVRRRLGRPVRDDQYLSGREVAVLSWAGTRGVITLAAIFTLPLTIVGGRPFPGRDLELFCAFLVVVVTLVGQGLTFGFVARALGVHADQADEALVRTRARAASVQAGLARLDQLAEDDGIPGPALAALRTSLDNKARRYGHVLDRLETSEDNEPVSAPDYEPALHARRAVIGAQREELLRWRDAGHLPDASLRILERELDHEERTLPPHDDGH
jgi:monovalent cation/hydrogen antiporter